MDLLDRYLQAVQKHLPWKRQDDILAELRANLESQLEEHESALGRPLNQTEAEAWLKEIGPPIQVAARYLPQQYLIGPSLFPSYWFVLRTSMIWGFVFFAIVSAVQIMASGMVGAKPDSELAWNLPIQAVFNIPFALLQVAAWITLTFAAFEFAVAHEMIRWPGKLAPSADWLPSKLPAGERAATGVKPRTRAQAIATVVFGALLVIVMLLIPNHPVIVFGPGIRSLDMSHFAFAPACFTFYWWMVAFSAFQVVWNAVDLARGRWQTSWLGKHLIFKAFGLLPLALLIAAPGHMLLILRDPLADSAKYGDLVQALNHWSHVGLLIALVMSICQLMWDASQWGLGRYRSRVAGEQ